MKAINSLAEGICASVHRRHGERTPLASICSDVAAEVRFALQDPFGGGRTHLRFPAEDFLARLAALVPAFPCSAL